MSNDDVTMSNDDFTISNDDVTLSNDVTTSNFTLPSSTLTAEILDCYLLDFTILDDFLHVTSCQTCSESVGLEVAYQRTLQEL